MPDVTPLMHQAGSVRASHTGSAALLDRTGTSAAAKAADTEAKKL